MPQLALFLLGPPYIERDGELISVDTRKAIALLAYLAVTRQRHSRDSLANLLWPDYDQVNARATLRRTLSALNKALAGDWLDIDRETIGLAQGTHFRLDVDEFHKCLAECRTHGHPASETCPNCLKPLAQAVTLYRGDFMAGFSLRDSPNFDDWQFFQADSLRRELSHALGCLVHGYTAQGNFETAITYARRWLALDRLHEPAHRHLMQLYAWAGQRAAALHQYRECVQALEQELGVTPLESTTQLYQSIKENRIPPPPVQANAPVATQEIERPAAPASSNPASSPGAITPAAMQFPVQHNDYPLLGRASEWNTLLQAYAASSTSGHLILLEGEAGIGKTRLAEEMVAHVHKQGASVIAAHCYEGETQLAYGPFVAGMRTAIAQQQDAAWLRDVPALWVSEAARLLPELTSLRPEVAVAPPLDHPGAQGRFFEGLRHVLLALLKGDSAQPGIVFFDDMQWADEASLDLLAYLVRRLREHPLCLLITWRTHAIPRDHHLYRLLADAQRSGNATILSLTRLDRHTVQQLAQSVVPASPAATTDVVQRLYEETEGLPFFLIEYLTAIAKGVLAPENERWSLPGGVRDLLHSRLDAVDEIGWQLLATAAAIGRSFDFDTLREASGRGEEETVTALEELIALGLVAEEPGGNNAAALTYDFSHEKLRTLVYEETSLARRRLLHRRIAEVLVGHERGKREPGFQPGQIAQHYRLAGNENAAAEYYKRAGERARTLYANTEALAHFHLALALGHPDRAGLHEAIGDLHTLMGEYAAALKSYETAAALGSVEALPTIEQKLGNVYGRRGEWELAESHLEAALFALGEGGSAGERAKIYADWSLAAYRHGQAARALELAHLALELAEAGSDRQALAQVHNLLGILASSKQQTEQAHHHLEESLALADGLNDASIQAAALNNLALAYAANGETERAIALAENALALCVSQGDRHREAALHSNLADMLHAAGRAEEAMPHLKQAVSIYAEIGVEAGTVQPEIWKLVEW